MYCLSGFQMAAGAGGAATLRMFSMMQAPLLPVVCHRTKPPPATAAADFIGIDDETSHRWLCKGQGKHVMVPATEWVCSSLATACGLPVPPFAAVQLAGQPGRYYFGSQWQGGASEFLEVRGRISNASVFQRTHAVDLFVHNTDRHFGNFLYLHLAGDVVARVIDFSHSLLVMGWPLPALPMAPCNTTLALPLFMAEKPERLPRPEEVIARISSMPADWMTATLAPMPEQWLDASWAAALVGWWSGEDRQRRLATAQSLLP